MSTLEDTQFSNPGLVEFLNNYYVPRGYPPGICAENVYMFFMNSPFLDRMSNNGILLAQSHHNPKIEQMVWDRKALEATLATMSGTEFRVVEGPETSFGAPVNPVWVIRKQVREKRRGMGDKITVEATYFVMGEFIYMAPSLEDVLRVRLMAATRALQKFYKAATELQFYTPDRGYTYHAPISKHKALTSLESTRTSRANSPIPDTASQTSLQPAGTKETQQQQQQQGNDDRAIATSFSLALQWGNEYMDENPLIGEPGALKLSSTSRQLKDQQDRTEASKTAQKEREKMNESARASIAATPTPAPAPIKTDLKKSSVSKGKSPISAVSDGGIKKAGRRKSMKPGTPGVGSPS